MLAKVRALRPSTLQPSTPQPTRPLTPQSALQLTPQPAPQNPILRPSKPTPTTIPPIVPVKRTAFTFDANTGTVPPHLQPTATNFVPTNAANPVLIHQTQQYQP
jgi:hypothetical protein